MAADRMRDEAERLVAAALAAVSSATRGLGAAGVGFSTGSPECCVCPVCRAIAAMRDPNSDLADRLSAGVGDLATGVATILRTLSTRAGRPEAAEEPSTSEGDQLWEDLRRKAADAARAYVRPSTGDTSESTVDDPWRAATREPAPTTEVPTAVPPALIPRPTVAEKPVAKKAVAKKTTAPGASQQDVRSSREREERGTSPAVASNRGAERTGGAGTRGTVAKKAVAKKAVKKAAPPDGAA
jgi:hypothetical protein